MSQCDKLAIYPLRERNAQVYTHQTHYRFETRFETRGAGYYSLTLQKDTAKQVLQNIQQLLALLAHKSYSNFGLFTSAI